MKQLETTAMGEASESDKQRWSRIGFRRGLISLVKCKNILTSASCHSKISREFETKADLLYTTISMPYPKIET